MNKTFVYKAITSLIFALFLIPTVSYAQTSDPNFIVETAVRMTFASAPDMIAIAKCESGFRQFAPDGSVLHGGTGGQYVGIFQFNYAIHNAKALSLGYDINTIDGNIGYAKYEYNNGGTGPWKACVPSPTQVPAPAPTPTPSSAVTPPAPPTTTVSDAFTSTMDFGQSGSQVLLLQQSLNKLGYKVADSGPGSPGNETTMFGSLTKAAVQKFQCDKGIVCQGSASTTGYGRVGPHTMAALNQALGF